MNQFNEIKKIIERELKRERSNTLYWILGAYYKDISPEAQLKIRNAAEAIDKIINKPC